jgi:hypothetical protein
LDFEKQGKTRKTGNDYNLRLLRGDAFSVFNCTKSKRFLSVFFVFICFFNEELPMPLSWILKNREKQEKQKNKLF